ncbi:hypothetical protein AMTRI_Chr02g212210 [Amborella trichopoda]
MRPFTFQNCSMICYYFSILTFYLLIFFNSLLLIAINISLPVISPNVYPTPPFYISIFFSLYKSTKVLHILSPPNLSMPSIPTLSLPLPLHLIISYSLTCMYIFVIKKYIY